MSRQLSARASKLASIAGNISTRSVRPDIANQTANPSEFHTIQVIVPSGDMDPRTRVKAALYLLLALVENGDNLGAQGVIKHYASMFEFLHPGFAKKAVTANYGLKLETVTAHTGRMNDALFGKVVDVPATNPSNQTAESSSAAAKEHTKKAVMNAYTVGNINFSGQYLPTNLGAIQIRCMCALLVYLVGKQPNQANFPQSYHNRLQNFANMFAIKDFDLEVMKGKFYNLDSIVAVYGALNWNSSFRISVANVFFEWRTSGINDPNKTPIITLFNLLDGSGLKYIDLVSTLVAAVPEVCDYKPFQTYMPAVERALDVYSKLDAERVGYVRIIQHRVDKLPTSNELSLVVACAKKYHAILQPTLGNYAQGLSAQHAGAIEEFVKWLQRIDQLPESTATPAAVVTAPVV